MDRRTFLQTSASALTATAASLQSSSLYAQTAKALTSDGNHVQGMWLNNEPLRISWFTLPASNAALDPQAVANASYDLGITMLVLTAGGSTAFYPTTVPFHDRSASLKEGTDFYGNVSKAAKTKGMRVGARFDFSKQSKAALEAHPEWFYRHADGTPAVDTTGRYMPCINTDFYHVQAVKIVNEVMDRYNPSLVFFNSFGNFQIGFGGSEPCHCESCQKAHKAATGKPVPAEDSAEYQAFLKESMRKSAALVFDAAHAKNPNVIVINADTGPADGFHSEDRMPSYPQPVWVYHASESVNRQRNSYPEKAAVNMVVGYSWNFSRLVVTPADEMRVSAFQSIAHGSPLTYTFTGTPANQPDQRDVMAVKEVMAWHRKNEDLYNKRVNLAKILLLVEPETAPRHRNIIPEQTNRGMYRMLTELHLPVAVSETTEALKRETQYDLVIVTEGAPTDRLEEYARSGGRVLFVNRPAAFGFEATPEVVKAVATGYAQVRKADAFPSLAGLEYVSVSGGYSAIGEGGSTERQIAPFYKYPTAQGSALTFVAPFVENPVEFFAGPAQTDIPAYLRNEFGKGVVACLPWDIGGFYFRQAIPIHRELLSDLIDTLLPGGRQLRSDVHPSVEMVLSATGQRNRAVLHMVNLSGQTQTGFAPPIPFRNFTVKIQGKYQSAISRTSGVHLKAVYDGTYTSIVVSELGTYDAVVLT